MRLRRASILVASFFAALGWWGVQDALAPVVAVAAQNSAGQAPEAPGVIKAEAGLVLVDVIVQDKKANYIRDLEAKDFHVFEDEVEQAITSFSRAADTKISAPDQKRYLVLFFDNSTMAPVDQIRARDAASQFVEKNASPDRQMAIVDFGGAFRVAQNFTADPAQLKRAIAGVKFSAVQPNVPGQTLQVASLNVPSLGRAGSDFAARSVLLAIRGVAKILRSVPGRKTLVFFSGGFPLTPERQAELTATIDALNKANIAVYPVDVRGLQGTTVPGFDSTQPGARPDFPPGASLNDDDPPFPHQPALLASLMAFPDPSPQRAGGAGGSGGAGGVAGGGGGSGAGGGGGGPSGGGGTAGGGPGGPGGTGGGAPGDGNVGNQPSGSFPGGTGNTGNYGGRGGTGGNLGNRPFGTYGCGTPDDYMNPNCAGRGIIPPQLESVTTNQQVLYALANGTGGFTIFNTNDFIAGLEKISKELGEYYILGYVPPSQEHDGSYHGIKVKVERKGLRVRSRTGYFDVKSPDLLAGKPEGKLLEERAASPQPGNIPVSLSVPNFYTSPGVARVNLTLEAPGSALDFEKLKGKLHSEVNVLGIAYREDGSVAARFSDTVKLNYEKKEWKEFAKGSFLYKNTFNIAPGKYKLKVVLGAGGEKFGKFETSLAIDPFDGKQFQLSGPALSDQWHPISQLAVQLDAALLEERTPLLFQGMEIVPSSNNRFRKEQKVSFYVEVYEPLLQTDPAPRVGVLYDIVNRKTNQQVYSSNTILVNPYVQEGNPLVPVAIKMAVDQLQAGEYRLEVRARDSAGNVSSLHSADFLVD